MYLKRLFKKKNCKYYQRCNQINMFYIDLIQKYINRNKILAFILLWTLKNNDNCPLKVVKGYTIFFPCYRLRKPLIDSKKG